MKKSKFLKKSLAMLLALMLVVAMIPLSAAASPVNLGAIYVDGNRVELAESMTVDVTDQSLNDGFSITTNEDLRALDAELRIYQTDGVTYTRAKQVSATPAETLDLDNYLVNGNTIKLALYDLGTTDGTGDDVELGSYTLTLKKVQGSTTTNLSETYVAGKGVVSATIDNVTKTINVKLARHTEDEQADLDARMTVTAVDNAKITNVNGTPVSNGGATTIEIDADDKSYIEVTSQTRGNVSKFTVVATYEDALATMEIQGLDGKWYSGSIVDTNEKDDIPDAIIFNLPDVAVEDPAHPGEKIANPKLNVRYTTQGDVDSNVVVTVVDDDGNSNDTNVKSGKEGSRVTFTDLGGANEAIATGSEVVVTRLPKANGAVQTYNLTVQLQKSTVTTIEYARVNDTIATVDQETGSITAELPKYQDTPNTGTATDPSKSKLVVYTDPSVSSVVVNGVALGKITKANAATLGQLDYDAATAEGKLAWVSVSSGSPAANVDLSKKQIITVTAEDEQTTKQYTISASISQNTSDADLTAFWLKNGANTYKGKLVNKDTIQVNVPYMTTNVSNWVVYATPTAGAKVVNGNGYEVVNGWTKGNNIGLNDVDEDPMTDPITLFAINKNNETISHKYTIYVVLDPAKTGNTLNSLEFTAQNAKNNNNDKVVYRAIQRTGSQKNTFNAEVDQQSNLTNNVGNITLEVPVSLSNNAAYTAAGISYHNVVTGFATDNGGVAYVGAGSSNLNWDTGTGTYTLKRLEATTNDISDQKLTGSTIANLWGSASGPYDEIIVLPEKYARQVELNASNTIDVALVKQYGTKYDIVVEVAKAQTGHDLQSMSFGNTPLTIEGDTIKGELPYSLTADTVANGKAKAMFATFETSQYAALFMTNWTKDSTKYMYSGTFTSDGDTNGDGEPEPIAKDNNYSFFFVRNPDHTVEVYAYAGVKGSSTYNLTTSADSNSNNPNGFETGISVLAEDRLSGSKTSFSNYKFELTWAEPCRDADIESFKLGNYTGSIDGNRNITVTVPYGTDVTGMIATFTTSMGATIQVGSENSGVALISDVTSVNYTNPVKLYVTSESGNVTRMYTVTVEEGVSFSDVTAGAWYYENVMGAAENGYVSGYPDGTFKPMQSVTRAEFASMIAKAMGYDSDPDAGSAYPDVADDHWAKAAINFCAQNDIINGYDDGTFQPNKAITRQEAAAILNKAFELSVKYGVSTDLFPDNSSIAAWASDHVYAAKASGLMKG